VQDQPGTNWRVSLWDSALHLRTEVRHVRPPVGLGGGGPRRINQAPTGVPPFGTPCEANPNHRSKIARLLRRFRLFLCRPPCRINQAPTGVSPFGTARFTYAQRYATSVLLWAWGEGGPRRINQAPTGVPPFGTPCEANPNHRSKIARLLRRFRLFLCRPPCRINQAPTGVSPFGTARFTYAQRYATSVLLWAWGEGGRAGSTRHQLACLPLGHRARPIRTIGQKLPDS
jgi:hypothetical protein